MKLFFDKERIPDNVSRKYLSDWVKPLFKTPRHEIYGMDSNSLSFLDSPTQADAFVLPLTWNYYLENNLVTEAMSIIDGYNNFRKPIYTWNTGDFSFRLPNGNYYLFKHDCYNSLLRENENPYPVIIKDPLEYLRSDETIIFEKEDKPKIGFCGISDTNWVSSQIRFGKKRLNQIVQIVTKPYKNKTNYKLGFQLRNQILNLFSSSLDLDTKFIYRSRSSIHNKNKNFKLEFLNNIVETNYTICVRGAGNFSTRFYETLALGRIPILVNTDCVLPLNKLINWSHHCVIIDQSDLKNAIGIIKSFHSNLSKNDFKKLQIENRTLWKDKLTFNGFFNSFQNNEE